MNWRFWQRKPPTLGPRIAVSMAADGFYYVNGHRLCEDCWQPIPRYVDFPDGLVSPESDGDAGGYAKRRPMNVEGKAGIEALRKAVCLRCYRAAFHRVYPWAPLPMLRDLVMPATVRYITPPEPPMEHVPEPRA
jgi:hypothetical protein